MLYYTENNNNNNDSNNKFETIEKRLEIHVSFHKYKNNIINNGIDINLLNIQEIEWIEILKAAKCKIISKIDNENNKVHAYLLSESSLFVFSEKIILKTCGTTTPLHSIPIFLNLFSKHSMEVEYLLYFHRDWFFSEFQKYPYNRFEDEVQYIIKCFNKNVHHMVYHFQSENNVNIISVEHCENNQMKENNNDFLVDFVNNKKDKDNKCHFFEISMTSINRNVMDMFYIDHKLEAKSYLEKVNQLFVNLLHANESGIKTDVHFFKPCGCSTNGLYNNNDNINNDPIYIGLFI